MDTLCRLRQQHCNRDIPGLGRGASIVAAGLLSVFLVLASCAARADLDIAGWDALLAEAVDDGYVDYSRWADNPRFDVLVRQIATSDTAGMTRDEKLVFYINAYNILAARGILDGRSPASLFGRYLYFKRDKYQVAGRRISLHDLEHELIRPLQEPRIHFAIVCASASCPILQSEAYTLEQLDSQLDAAARGFINDTARNVFDVERGMARLSSIFKWFEEDFVAASGTLQAYLAVYVESEKAASMLQRGEFEVDYLPYDWSLNGTR